jgi:hypothetical protein
MAGERKKEINRRRHRKLKLRKLRNRLTEASSKADKEKIIAKIHKINPAAPVE